MVGSHSNIDNQPNLMTTVTSTTLQKNNTYAQPVWPGHQTNMRISTLPTKLLQAPPIPDPDYSLSESDDENENSILLAHNTKMNEHISLTTMPSESSGNSNTRYTFFFFII